MSRPTRGVFGPTNPEDLPNMRRVAVADDGRMVAAGFEWWAEPESVRGGRVGLERRSRVELGTPRRRGLRRRIELEHRGHHSHGRWARFHRGDRRDRRDNRHLHASRLGEPGPDKTRSRIILSEDGLDWTAVPEAQLPDGGEGAYIRHVIRGGPGFVAVGWRRNNPGVADADIDPVVWTSPDGESWTEAADPRGVLTQPGGQLIHKVVAGGPGLVAIGQDGGVKSYNTAIWTSP